MQSFTKITGVVAALNRANVDTDQIIPKQFLKRIERNGFERFLFFDWRYNEDGSDRADFELNQPEFAGAAILLTARNFGCGSSREHAVWALENQGFRVVIAPSFADIFFNNCFKNGVLPVILPEDIVNELFENVAASPGYELTVDLEQKQISDAGGNTWSFEVDEFRRHSLLNGLDDIAQTLQHEDKISAYEARV